MVYPRRRRGVSLLVVHLVEEIFVEAVLLVALGGAFGVAIGVGGALFLASDAFRDNIPIELRDLVPIPELSLDIVVTGPKKELVTLLAEKIRTQL